MFNSNIAILLLHVVSVCGMFSIYCFTLNKVRYFVTTLDIIIVMESIIIIMLYETAQSPCKQINTLFVLLTVVYIDLYYRHINICIHRRIQ